MIERYLDELLVCLRGRARDVRRILDEVEAHLRDAAEAGVRDGLAPDEAEAAAIAAFGSPRDVARRFSTTGPLVTGPLVREVVAALVLLGAVGLVAIGVSGVLAMGTRAAFGSSFVAGEPEGVTYTAARCADFREYHPEATTCEAAASAHHADEVEEYRVAAGVLGLFVLGGRWLVRRRRHASGAGTAVALPVGVVPAVGATLFGVAGVALLLEGLGLLATGGASHGSGQWLTAGVVALAVAAWYAVELLQTLRTAALRAQAAP
jgi:hypothetical protein